MKTNSLIRLIKMVTISEEKNFKSWLTFDLFWETSSSQVEVIRQTIN